MNLIINTINDVVFFLEYGVRLCVYFTKKFKVLMDKDILPHTEPLSSNTAQRNRSLNMSCLNRELAVVDIKHIIDISPSVPQTG